MVGKYSMGPKLRAQSAPLRHVKYDPALGWGFGVGIIAGFFAGAENVEALTHYLSLQADPNSVMATIHSTVDEIIRALNDNTDFVATVLNHSVGGAIGGIEGLAVGGLFVGGGKAITSARTGVKMVMDKLST